MAVLLLVPAIVLYMIGIMTASLGIPWFRLVTEGKAFSVSYSASYGDMALAFVVLAGGTIASRMTSAVLIWDLWFNLLLVIGLVTAGIFMQLQEGASKKPVDVAHSLIVIPVYGYLVVISELVLFQSSREMAILTGVVGPVIWLLLLMKDLRERRLDQHAYMERTGETAVIGLGWWVTSLNWTASKRTL